MRLDDTMDQYKHRPKDIFAMNKVYQRLWDEERYNDIVSLRRLSKIDFDTDVLEDDLHSKVQMQYSKLAMVGLYSQMGALKDLTGYGPELSHKKVRMIYADLATRGRFLDIQIYSNSLFPVLPVLDKEDVRSGQMHCIAMDDLDNLLVSAEITGIALDRYVAEMAVSEWTADRRTDQLAFLVEHNPEILVLATGFIEKRMIELAKGGWFHEIERLSKATNVPLNFDVKEQMARYIYSQERSSFDLSPDISSVIFEHALASRVNDL